MIAAGRWKEGKCIIFNKMTPASYAATNPKQYHTCLLVAPSRGRSGIEFSCVRIGMQQHHSSLSLFSRIGGNLAGSVLAKLIVGALTPW